MKLQVHAWRQRHRCPIYPVTCSLSELLIWGLTLDLSDSGKGSRWGPALPSFKRLAELKVAFKEGSSSCWADVWMTMDSVHDWESGLSSPVILCCHLRHLIVLLRQVSGCQSQFLCHSYLGTGTSDKVCVSAFLSSIGDTYRHWAPGFHLSQCWLPVVVFI